LTGLVFWENQYNRINGFLGNPDFPENFIVENEMISA